MLSPSTSTRATRRTTKATTAPVRSAATSR